MQHATIASRPIADIEIPVQFSRLLDIAYNLWWTWTPSARSLFRSIDHTCWDRYRNPIEVLMEVDPEHWHALQNDPAFVRNYRDLVERFDDYVFPGVAAVCYWRGALRARGEARKSVVPRAVFYWGRRVAAFRASRAFCSALSERVVLAGTCTPRVLSLSLRTARTVAP